MSMTDSDLAAEGYRQRPRYRCGGWASYSGPCGARDCESCYPGYDPFEDAEPETGEAETFKTVTAHKPRFVGTTSEIKPGDRVCVRSGFCYVVNGPRTGYFRSYRRLTKGPAWVN